MMIFYDQKIYKICSGRVRAANRSLTGLHRPLFNTIQLWNTAMLVHSMGTHVSCKKEDPWFSSDIHSVNPGMRTCVSGYKIHLLQTFAETRPQRRLRDATMDFGTLARLESGQGPHCLLISFYLVLFCSESVFHFRMAIHDPRKRKKSSVKK